MPDLASLTPRQAQRRARVLRAAVALAAEGGYEAVQIREVAARAEVALGTVYNYFVSKDHLLAAAMVQSLEAMRFEDGRAKDMGTEARRNGKRAGEPQADAAARVVAIFERSFRSLSDQPNVGRALLAGLNSPGPEVAQQQHLLHQTMSAILSDALLGAGSGGLGDTDGPDGPDEIAALIRTIEHVWGSITTGWMIGWLTPEQVRAEFSDAMQLLLAR